VRVVLDTNVLVSALRSSLGASFRVLGLVGKGHFELALSVPLVLEYEDVLLRSAAQLSVTASEINAVLNYLCSVAVRQEVFFLWRPTLKDPADDMVLEVAVASSSTAIVTFNRGDFAGSEKFGVSVWTPGELLRQIGEGQS
jgi:putative PIN family toxin of toxin-antitoxin system